MMKLNKWNNDDVLQNITNIQRSNNINIFFLYGEIGVGKTTFVRNFLNNNNVTSPTYLICNQYENIWHFDLYRTGGDLINLENIGLFHAMNNGMVFIEWAEKIENIDLIKNMYKNKYISLYFSENLIEVSF